MRRIDLEIGQIVAVHDGTMRSRRSRVAVVMGFGWTGPTRWLPATPHGSGNGIAIAVEHAPGEWLPEVVSPHALTRLR